MITQKQAIEYVVGIRKIQDLKHGNHKHSLPEWLLILRQRINEAERAWYRSGDTEAFGEVGHVAATALAAIEQTGVRRSSE